MKYLLTESVKHLKIPSIKVQKTFFPEGELRIKIKENLKNKPVTIISNVTQNNILELMFTVDAAKRMGAKIKEVVIPFLSYARQDKYYLNGEAVSGIVICSILKTLKVPITIFEAHSLLLRKSLRFKNASLLSMLTYDIPKKDLIVVSPDKGGAGRAKKIAKILEVSLVVIEKVRKDGITMKLEKDLTDKKYFNCGRYDKYRGDFIESC